MTLTRVGVHEAGRKAESKRPNDLVGGVEVGGEVVVREAGVVLLGRRVPETVEVDVRRVLVLREQMQRRSSRPESLKIEVEVEQVGALERAPRRRSQPEAFLPEIRAPITEAGREALTGAHAAEHDLRAVGSASGVEPFVEPAFDQSVDRLHQRRLPLGPELRDLIGTFSRDRLGPRRRYVGRWLLRRHWRGNETRDQGQARNQRCAHHDVFQRTLPSGRLPRSHAAELTLMSDTHSAGAAPGSAILARRPK